MSEPILTLPRLEQLLAQFPRLKLGLLGDLFLDRYLDIDSDLRELSVETGLEAYQITRIRNSPGALGTIINNLSALGVGRLVPITVVGDDGQAYDLLKELAKLPVDVEHVIRDAGRVTPTYTKPMKQDDRGAWHELNRLDLRNRVPLAAASEAQVIDRLNQVVEATDGLIVLDQVNEESWGVVTPRVRSHLESIAAREPAYPIFIDSRAHVAKFRSGMLKPNISECLRAIGRDPAEANGIAGDPDAPVKLAKLGVAELSRQTGRPVFCTLGELGILVYDPRVEPVLVPGYPVAGPIDPVGAGDSATSGIMSALLSGAAGDEAAALGNLVASVTVTQLGTTGTATPAQLIARLQEALA